MEDDNSKYWAQQFETATATPSAKTPQTASVSYLGAQTAPIATPQKAYGYASGTEPAWMNPDFLEKIKRTEEAQVPIGKYMSDDDRAKITKGDHGLAWGMFQQHADNVERANQILKKWSNPNNTPEDKKRYKSYLAAFPEGITFSPNDRLDKEKSTMIYDINMRDLTNQFRAKVGRDPTPREMAMLHNQGVAENAIKGKGAAYGKKFDLFDSEFETEKKAKQAKKK